MANDTNTRIAVEEAVRAAADSALADRASALGASLGAPAATVPVSAKPEIADKPSFLKDLTKGLVHVAKTAWTVPQSRGYIATVLVRILVGIGLPAGAAGIVLPIIDALVK